jgi:hypothetical protein
MYYCFEYFEFTNSELQKISEYKVWCRMNDNEISDRDEEILRMLYAKEFQNMPTKLAFENKEKLYGELCPIEIGEEIMEVLKNGACYIHGRDKNLRPLVFVKLLKLSQL